MVYADTDFFIALLKTSDWLKSAAAAALKRYAGQLWTSHITLIELLLLARDLDLDPERMLNAALETAELRGANPNSFLVAAGHMKQHGAGVFDSLHAAFCGIDEAILSSDRVFDRIGLTRIDLNG